MKHLFVFGFILFVTLPVVLLFGLIIGLAHQ